MSNNKADSLIQVGQISSVNTKNGSARVAFDQFKDDKGNAMVSGEMQLVMPPMGQLRMWYTPKIGDHVQVLRLPNGLQEGFILGTAYTASHLPMNGQEGWVRIESVDGKNSLALDANTGDLTITMDHQISVKMKLFNVEADDMTLKGHNTTTIHSPDVTITGGELTVDGVVSPTGKGPFCAVKVCPFNGVPHVGNKVEGT